MKIFGLNITLGRQDAAPVEDKEITNFRTINTEGMDLSQPFVDEYYNRSMQWVFFGEGNLYPQILNQLYISSPMHQACCNFKKYSLIGKGYEWQGLEDLSMSERIQIKQFETMSNTKQSFPKLALDWIKHGRMIVLVRYSKEHDRYTHFRCVDPENIRNSIVSVFKDTPDFYYYSRDWTRSFAQQVFKPVAPENFDEWQVMELKNEVGGFRSYGVPDWISSANWQKVGADIALLHKSAIENGIQPSVIYKYPYIMSPEEKQQWEEGMRRMAKGAKNYGRAMKVESQGRDMTPDIEVVKTTDNHKLFEQTSREYKEEVAISHNINPALMGVRIQGALGQKEEIEFSAKQFEKVWLQENREMVEYFFNKVSDVCGIKPRLNIKETDIITIAEMMQGETTTESGEAVVMPAGAAEKEAEARAQLKGSVGGVQGIIQIQTSVAQGLTDRDSAIALLELIYGFNNQEATRLLGDVKEGVIENPEATQPQNVNEAAPDQMSANVNDALKGLSAKDNQDLMRIVRDYSKGRLVESLARTRLMAYGIDAQTINEILAQ